MVLSQLHLRLARLLRVWPCTPGTVPAAPAACGGAQTVQGLLGKSSGFSQRWQWLTQLLGGGKGLKVRCQSLVWVEGADSGGR